MITSPTVAWLSQIVLLAISLLLFIPIFVLLVECLAALLPVRKHWNKLSSRPKIAVLMPAHNEALGIEPVLSNLVSQLQPTDRLIVIADNCTDSTAAVARNTGATVIERQDTDHRGKGYALDYGLQFLANDPPDVVIVVDADCMVQSGTLDRIAETAVVKNRPVQAVYLMEQPTPPKPKDTVSTLAFLVKNWVRPQGCFNLNLPGILTGTGMAFPWSVICQVSLASGNIVEDMQLSMDLAIAGYPTAFCPGTKVLGLLPQQDQAATTQRTRWEHGHLQTMRSQIPSLVKAAIQQKRFDLMAIALDLSIPPLSLLVMLWAGITFVAAMACLILQAWLPVMLLLLEGGMILMAILVAWWNFGRADLPARTLLAIPLYILWKIPLYFAFLVKPQTKWVRTERDAIDGSKS